MQMLKLIIAEIMLVFVSIICILLIVKEASQKDKPSIYYDDGTPAKIFITGDKHRNFERVKAFCRDMNTSRKDILIILGDAGFNYYDDKRDDKLKAKVSDFNITLFCLYGNKEKRPENISTYGIRTFCGGKVYYEPKYPNIYFAIDGEIYTFEGKKYIAAGGAHSVDKTRCLEKGMPFFEDEMPDATIKSAVEKLLEKQGNKIYGIMTHTCPLKYIPTEMFISNRRNTAATEKPNKAKSKKYFNLDIDRSTEEWLDKLEENVDYTVWFCGHYHIDKQIDKVNMVYHEIRPLHLKLHGDKE